MIMSLQAVSLEARAQACSLPHLSVWSRHGRCRSPRVVSFAKLLRQGKSVSSYTCSHTPLIGIINCRDWPLGLKATSLQAQALTADDSSSGEVIGSSTQALSLSSDELKHFLQSFLSTLQEGFRVTKEKGLLQSTKHGCEEALLKLKLLDGKRVLNEDVASKIWSQGAATWQNSKPWVKWPLAIFLAIFMVITVACGPVVGRDLTPLWILGPLITGAIIRTAFFIGVVCRDAVESSAPLRRAIVEDAKSGVLVRNLNAHATGRFRELEALAGQKREELIVYVRSGQAANDVLIYLQMRYSDLSEWSLERYEDFIDWWRPFMRAFMRLIKKLF